jgi:hypothetical protein
LRDFKEKNEKKVNLFKVDFLFLEFFYLRKGLIKVLINGASKMLYFLNKKSI